MPTNKHLLLIGAPKCGTTSLANWLAGHSRINLVAGKEPGFFRTRKDRFVLNAHKPEEYSYPDPKGPMKNLEGYLRLSAPFAAETWSLDASTDYLSDPGAPDAIADFAQTREVKLICMLRDPVERAFSEYKHTLRDGLEPLTFLESLSREAERFEAGYQPLFFHIRRSRYFESIARYRALFGEDLLVLSYSDLSDPATQARRILEHVDLEYEDLGDIGRLNASDRTPEPKNHSLKRALKSIKRLSAGSTPEKAAPPRPDQAVSMSSEMREAVLALLKDDIARCVEDRSIPTGDWTCLSDQIAKK